MSGAAGWFGSGAGLVIGGVSFVILRFLHHLPSAAHPWLHRAAIVGMYAAGCLLALTVVGGWVISALTWALGYVGGPGSGTGHAIVTIAALILTVTIGVALIWVPDALAAWLALALPFVLVLTGGHLHDILSVFPGSQIGQQVSSWLGG